MKTTSGLTTICCCTLTIAMSAVARATYGQVALRIYTPAEASTNLDGNSSLFAPFATFGQGRFQQVYSSSLFSSVLPSGGGDITAFSYRVDAQLGLPFMLTVTNMAVSLSTTFRSPDGLSGVFSENVGSDERVVMGPGSIFVQGAGGGGSTGFDVNFLFIDRPFHYDPANGNLLVDFRIFTGAGNPSPEILLDAFDVSGDTVSSALGYGSGGSLPASGQASSLGLATAFSVHPVPEPSSFAMLGIGLAAMGVYWNRLKRGKEMQNVAD